MALALAKFACGRPEFSTELNRREFMSRVTKKTHCLDVIQQKFGNSSWSSRAQGGLQVRMRFSIRFHPAKQFFGTQGKNMNREVNKE